MSIRIRKQMCDGIKISHKPQVVKDYQIVVNIILFYILVQKQSTYQHNALTLIGKEASKKLAF